MLPIAESSGLRDIIQKDLKLGRIHGPFNFLPFGDQSIFSPVFVVPKDDGQDWRLIHHLSFPYGSSVNDAISDVAASVQYEPIDHVLDLLYSLGPGALLGRWDIKSAFKLCPVHPEDYKYLCFVFNKKFYYETCLSFGLRCSCQIFEKFACFIQWLLKWQTQHHFMSHYLDDSIVLFPASASAEYVNTVWTKIFHVADLIGLPIALEKTSVPSTVIRYLGFVIDTNKGILFIPREKQKDIFDSILFFLSRDKVKLFEVQSILGKLAFASKVIPLARPFLRRLYKFIALFKSPKHFHRIPKFCRHDLKMWSEFFQIPLAPFKLFDRISLSNADVDLYTDSSANFGFGALLGNRWISQSWDKHFECETSSNSITFLEMFPLVVSVVVWKDFLRYKKVRFFSDNLGLVHAVNKMTASDVKLLSLLRYFVVVCVTADIQFMAVHVPGVQNASCDALSRGLLEKFFELNPNAEGSPTIVPNFLWSICD